MVPLDIDRMNAMSAAELAALFSTDNAERHHAIKLAAEAGLADAQALYGQMLLDGRDVAQNQREAISWFHKAAEQGHAMAINMIGRCYDLGWGVAVDKTRAAQWFKIAADKGLDWGLYNYATLLALGSGVDEDKATALALFQKAAAMGNAKAMNFVGSFYEDGWVVRQNMRVAAYHYRQAAEGGDFRGQFNHARILADGGDMDAALQWLSRVRETATPAFLAKAHHWLAASSHERLRTDGIAALNGS